MITTKTDRPPLGVAVGVAERVGEAGAGVADAGELAGLGLEGRGVAGLEERGGVVLIGEDEAGLSETTGLNEGLGELAVNSGRTGVDASVAGAVCTAESLFAGDPHVSSTTIVVRPRATPLKVRRRARRNVAEIIGRFVV